MRVNIVGISGVGKTTLGRRLANRLHCPFAELDDFHWGPDWQARPREELRANVAEFVRQPAWVIDGNYADRARDLIWPHTDLVVWLDFSLPIVVWRLLRRTVRRAVRKERLWSAGNRESFKEALFSRDSLLVWAVRDFRPRREVNLRQLSQPGAPRYHRLCHPRELEVWWKQFTEG